jgi:cytochrome oxidase Cu insertion factor (SCO1/SenC/PrrC family)
MKRVSWPRWLVPLLGLLAVLALTQLPRLMEMAPQTAAIGGPFTLTDQQGRTVHDSDFRGKLMLIYFGYTFCPDVCPTTLNRVVQAYRGLSPEQQAQIAPIFITVDPERDTVEQMAQYAPSFSPALVALTGSPEQIAAVSKSFRVYARKSGSGPNYGVDHSSILYLMGKDGRFLRHFDGNASAEEIAAGLKQALG